MFSINIYRGSLEGGNINSLTSVTVARNKTVIAVSVSSGRENKRGGVRVIITLEVCKCMCISPGSCFYSITATARPTLHNNLNSTIRTCRGEKYCCSSLRLQPGVELRVLHKLHNNKKHPNERLPSYNCLSLFSIFPTHAFDKVRAWIQTHNKIFSLL